MRDGEAIASVAAADRPDLDQPASETTASELAAATTYTDNPHPATSSGTTPRSRGWLNALRKPDLSSGPRPSTFRTRPYLTDDDVRRDSGLAPSTSTGGRGPLVETQEKGLGLRKVSSPPSIIVQDEPVDRPVQARKFIIRGSTSPESRLEETRDLNLVRPFTPIDTEIPRGSFDENVLLDRLEFSTRGSILLAGKSADMAARRAGTMSKPARAVDARKLQAPTSSSRVLSMDEIILSRRVRAMYECGGEDIAQALQSGTTSATASIDATIEEDSGSESGQEEQTLTIPKVRQNGTAGSRSASRMTIIKKEPFEIAGGIEDWEDVQGGETDRYGFILPKKPESRVSSNNSAPPERPQMQRVSTSLRLISEAPRRNRTLHHKTRTAKSPPPAGISNTPKRNSSRPSVESPGSIYSYQSTNSLNPAHNPFRYAANRLPHNRERRWMDEASDMLTLPPGLADIAEQQDGGKTALETKRKEWAREEKWRKMGKATAKSGKGGGMIFEFDTKDPKLISRTWKGIPDRWRASAWRAFLSASVKRDKSPVSDEELIECFHELQEESSADDVQIDVDIPRTINNHIMFRRRYRGGQRLLFRILHAISLYLPDTGYVQGMAALAATLLCYYDEENAFVMLVRMWQHRGLDRLYQDGFGGLMEALDDFERNWLCGGDVAKHLQDLGVSSTAYGTRWYLTLFNYSIPFPAQLRVWDVFMLLGDASNRCPSSSLNSTTSAPRNGDLDVLHATSAALIDATREILLDSDFENAMKVLTSWIPIRDEDLLMRVAKAEWKMRRKRAARAAGGGGGGATIGNGGAATTTTTIIGSGGGQKGEGSR